MRASAGLALGAFALAACGGGPTAPDREIYTLETVNGVALPAVHPSMNVVEVVEGSLTLSPDGTVVDRLRVRCRDDLPEGTECGLVNGGRTERTGLYDRTEGWLEFGGTRVGATFGAGSIAVAVVPPSQGLPSVTFRYGR